MDIHIQGGTSHEFDPLTLQKMVFLYNALEKGWTIKKKKNLYIFSKNHGGKKEVYLDNYIKRFMEEHFDIETLLSN